MGQRRVSLTLTRGIWCLAFGAGFVSMFPLDTATGQATDPAPAASTRPLRCRGVEDRARSPVPAPRVRMALEQHALAHDVAVVCEGAEGVTEEGMSNLARQCVGVRLVSEIDVSTGPRDACTLNVRTLRSGTTDWIVTRTSGIGDGVFLTLAMAPTNSSTFERVCSGFAPSANDWCRTDDVMPPSGPIASCTIAGETLAAAPIDVRGLLCNIGFDPDHRRLGARPRPRPAPRH